MGDHLTDHQAKTRSLRPIDNITYSSNDMLTGVLASVSAASVLSINQLHGDRKGVVRLTCKSADTAKELDTRVAARRVQINGVRLAPVSDSGHFIKLTLMDVPQYLSCADIERELSVYGSVVNVRRDYIEYQGYRLENETRHVLLTSLVRDVPSRITMDGNEVFVTFRPTVTQAKSRQSSQCSEPEPLISQPNYIPKHVMTSIYNSTSETLRRGGGGSGGGQLNSVDPSDVSSSSSDRELDLAADGSGGHLKPAKQRVGKTTSPGLSRRVILPADTSDNPELVLTKHGDRRGQDEAEIHLPVVHTSRRPRPVQAKDRDVGPEYPNLGLVRRRSFDCERDADSDVIRHPRYGRSKTPDAETHI